MIFLGLDLIISRFSLYPTFFFLINLVLLEKTELPKLVIITLVLDLLVLNTYFLNTIIVVSLFFILKKMKIWKVNIYSYTISLLLISYLYIIIIGLINKYSLGFLNIYYFKNIIYSLIFYLLCYKIVFKNIKLSR